MHCVVFIAAAISAVSPSVQEILDRAVKSGEPRVLLPTGRVRVEDVTIRRNTIEDVGRDGASHSSRAYVLGAISVFGRTDRTSQLPLWPGSRNIVIEDNVIRDCPGAGIVVAAAKDVEIRGNRLVDCFTRPGESSGRDRGLDVRGVIDARHAKDVIVEDNEIIAHGERPESPE